MVKDVDALKRVTADQLRKNVDSQTYRTITWNGIEVTVRPLLTLRELTQFVNSVLDGCYDKEHDIFIPEMKDFAIRFNTVLRYACVELPDDIEEQYTLLYGTDIYETIVSAVNRPQFDSILDAINICIGRYKAI